MSLPKANSKDQAVVALVSGGLDSLVVAAMVKAAGYRLFALTIDYNQRHRVELEAAKTAAKAFGAERHVILPVDLTQFGGSALTDAAIDVPQASDNAGIPITYVPARNTIFLSLALGWAEAVGARDLAIGVNALDYSGYPDCRPDFIQAFEKMAMAATKAGNDGDAFRIHTPLIELSKAGIVQAGLDLGVDFGISWSCYDPTAEGKPCGRCDSCHLRAKGFAEVGVADPALV